MIGLFLFALDAAYGDAWLAPATALYTSRDGNVVVRIEPALREKDAHPVAIITRWSPKESAFLFERRVTLRNPRSPVTAVVTNDAHFLVTFDDWCDVGLTDNAIVIYNLESNAIHHFRLEDFVPEAYRRAFRQSTSSVMWREEPFVIEPEHIVEVPLAQPRTGKPRFKAHFEIDPAKSEVRIKNDE